MTTRPSWPDALRAAPETITRLDFAAQGLPEPELNADVTDRLGQWVAQSDFVWKHRRVVAEYDGLHHGKPRQRDASRPRLIEDADWEYVQLAVTTLADPFEHDAVIGRLRRFLTEGLDVACRLPA